MAPRAAPGPVVLMADCSEFQPDIHDAAYLRWSKAIVIRALYGTRVDRAWYGGARRDALHAGGARFVGIYAYITSQDVTAQAKAMISLLGKLRPGEKVIADIEEGTREPAGPLGHLGQGDQRRAPRPAMGLQRAELRRHARTAAGHLGRRVRQPRTGCPAQAVAVHRPV